MNIITDNMLDDDIDFNSYLDSTEHQMTVRQSSCYIEDVIDHFHGETGPFGTRTPFRKLDGLLRFRPSEVTLWGGMSGHGKSMLLGQAVLGFMAQGEKTVIASMEMTPKATLARACRQGEASSRPSKEFITEFLSLAGDYIWLYDQQGMVRADRIAGMSEYCANKLGVKHIVIDSLMKCGLGEDDYNGQKRFVDRLCTIAHDTGAHIHLVAHTRKQKDELTPPNKMDILGASSITNQVDNVIMVWRNKGKEHAIADGSATTDVLAQPDSTMAIHKQRHGEWEGTANLWFDPASLQFLEQSGGHPVNLLNPSFYE